ncbi:Crp/Fnr family transcriptional regulator [Lujinxingia sediminis]|nr:cyclic nucleotide-binding domain-containing protein [Lujinxingia sediminis]
MQTDRHRLAREALRARPFFDTLSDEEFERLIDACDLRTLAPREVLWAVGRQGQSCYVLISGRLEQSLTRQPAGRKVTQIDRPGTFMALSYLVKPWRHHSSTIALERSVVLKLDRERFEAMFEAGDAVAFRLVDELAEALVQEMRDANERLHEVFGNPAETLRLLRRRTRNA